MPDGAEWIVLGSEAEGLAHVRLSDAVVRLERHIVPKTLEIKVGGDGEPQTYAKVVVSESGSKVTELRFTSTDADARGVQQSDLREVEVRSLLEDLVAMFTIEYELVPVTVEGVTGYGLALSAGLLENGDIEPGTLHLAQSLRRGRRRDITAQLLAKVAEIYRTNIDRAPTKAVEHHFQVSQRMAAEYVSQARKRGFLPPTKRGKKQA